jgi:hypothetical protein
MRACLQGMSETMTALIDAGAAIHTIDDVSDGALRHPSFTSFLVGKDSSYVCYRKSEYAYHSAPHSSGSQS